MKITICAVGRLRKGPEKVLIDDYLMRFEKIGRGMGLGPATVTEVEAKKSNMAEEAVLLERAVPEVDELLKEAYAQRAQFRETRSGPAPFLDTKNYGQRVSTLPSTLRPQPGGLDAAQLAL